jgi:hypothetical protein
METMLANESLLLAQGRIGIPEVSASAVLLEWPVVMAPGVDDFDCWAIVNFVDHNPNPGEIMDYNCGTRSYDNVAYDHRGVDFMAWPFPWIKVDNEEMYVVAARAGVIVDKEDGNFDRQCRMIPGNTANNVLIRHDDGTRLWYGHMKTGSLTTKQIGDSVKTGDFLGVVASSGQSPAPHMHMEMFDRYANLIDPFEGPCNGGGTSWWKEQVPYYMPGINKVSTHSQQVDFNFCPDAAVPNYKNEFQPGEKVFAYAFGRDLLDGMDVTIRLLRPDGSEYDSRTFTNSTGYHNMFYHWYATTMPSGQDGIWTVAVDFDGATYEQEFQVGTVAVTFQSIDAYVIDTGVVVEWGVYADEPISGYDILRDDRSIASVASGDRRFTDHDVEPGKSYAYAVVAQLPDGRLITSPTARISTPGIATALSQNHPNPFNPTTTIQYTLAEDADVTLAVYDISGRRVAQLEKGRRRSGVHSIVWSGRDENGRRVASGTYLYRLTVDGASQSRKMILLK